MFEDLKSNDVEYLDDMCKKRTKRVYEEVFFLEKEISRLIGAVAFFGTISVCELILIVLIYIGVI